MKKYLMTGIAALAMCFGFTSCSHDVEPVSQEDLNQLEAQKIVNNYNQAFLRYVGGNIAANQTWGFGGYSTFTRSRIVQQLVQLKKLMSWRIWQLSKLKRKILLDFKIIL